LQLNASPPQRKAGATQIEPQDPLDLIGVTCTGMRSTAIATKAPFQRRLLLKALLKVREPYRLLRPTTLQGFSIQGTVIQIIPDHTAFCRDAHGSTQYHNQERCPRAF
jgi:hypothetical protein